MNAGPVAQRVQAGPVIDLRRRQHHCALTAATRLFTHRPPPITNVSRPCSGKLGSLSSRAISNGPRRQQALLALAVRPQVEPFQLVDDDAGDAWHVLRPGDQLAQIDAFAKG